MNTTHIESILLPRCKDFIGVFSAEQLPRTFKDGSLLIVNTDCRCKPGQHWLAMHVKNKHIEVFDSFGAPIKYYAFIHKIPGYSYSINRRQIQSLLTSVCGQYATLYVLYKQKKLGTMDSFLKLFGLDRLKNDRRIWKIFHREFQLQVPLHDPRYNNTILS